MTAIGKSIGKSDNSVVVNSSILQLIESNCFDSNGLAHKTGGRVATMVMYCDTTGLVGGATNFGKAGVYVKPNVGAAAFFSYLDPETHIHETGYTTHSGCPVVEGIKRIAVHWMRIGVDKERPWDSFNTNNVHKSDCDDDDD